MTKSLCIFTCRNFMCEVASAVTAEGWNDVEVVSFPARCGRPRLTWDELRPLLPTGCSQLVLLGSACLGELGDPPSDFPPARIEKVSQCFHLVAGQNLVDETIVSGGYLMTPAWLAEWRKHLGEMGFEPENAVDFFRDFARELVLLDTGIDPMSGVNLAELQRTINLDTRRIPIGLDHVRLFLAKIVMEYRFEKERRTLIERDRLNVVKLADQAAAIDMLMRLAKIQDEDISIETIKEFFQMLFAPKALYYLKVEQQLSIPAQSIPAGIQASMIGLQDDYALTPDGLGFLLRIRHCDELLGIFAVDQLTFPEYRSRYLNTALAVTDIFALVVKNSREIVERKRLENEKHLIEQQFQQIQKLESLGVLAGGIAHDFNNILAIIVGYCGMIKMGYESAEKNIPEIEKAAERAAALCRQMLAYAGESTLSQGQINPWRLADEMVSMLKTTIQQNIVIKSELDTDLPSIMGDAGQLRQVVMDLIINAAEAIGEAYGEIDVKLAKAEIKAEQPEKDHLGMTIPAGQYICFEVTDNGCGMDEDTRRKIFEPFYTTKFTGRGLGLSAVLGIIKAHNGAVQLKSRLGLGTTFRIYLPVQLSKSESEGAQQITALTAWQGSGTILLVEDEEQVKSIGIMLLQEFGFTVLDAANGKEALELYQQNAADITLVVTDMGMPVMNGYELFHKLKKLDPQLPIIVTSGFGEGDIYSKIPSEEIAGLINKPYRFEHFRDVLRGVVEGPTDRRFF